MMSEKMGPIISTNGLVFCVDAANPQSINFAGSRLTDLSNGYVGQNVNNPTFVNSGITSYVLFDGTDDAMIFNESILSKTQYTKTAWYYIASVASGSSNNIISGGADSNHYFYPAGSQWLRAGHNGLDSYQTVTSQNIGKAIQFDKWNFGAVTYSSTNGWKLYVADSLADADSSTVTFDGTQYFRLASYGGGNLLNGRIAQALIYNRVLTPFEIYQNYNATKGRYGIPDIVMGGLVLNLDAGNPYSYNPDNTGSTVWTDVSYTSSGGTLINGASYTGGTIQFDGTNDYVICNTPNVFNLVNDLTLSCWAKPMGNSGIYRVIIGKYYTNNNPTYELGISNGNKFYWYGNGVDKYGTTNIQLNTFYNFVITINSSDKTGVLYINGSVEASISGLATQVANNGPLYVGVDAPTGVSEGAFFNGNVGNVQIYNRALTQAEITQNFNALRGRYGI
jgi:hypothetical protein